MPNLQWNGIVATTTGKKAEALRSRFFPVIDSDLTTITNQELAGGAPTMELYINPTADEWEVYAALKRAKPDKSLGADEIPNRLLHATGEPLV